MGRTSHTAQPCTQTDRFLQMVAAAQRGYSGNMEGRKLVLQDNVLHVIHEDTRRLQADTGVRSGIDYSVLLPIHQEKEAQRKRWEQRLEAGAGSKEEETAFVRASMEESRRLLIDIAAAQHHRHVRLNEELSNPNVLNTKLPEVTRPPTPPTFKRQHKQLLAASSPRAPARSRRGGRDRAGGVADADRRLPPTDTLDARAQSPLSRGGLTSPVSSGEFTGAQPAGFFHTGTHTTAKSVTRQLQSHVSGSYKRVQHSKFKGVGVGVGAAPNAKPSSSHSSLRLQLRQGSSGGGPPGTWPRQLKGLATLSVPLVKDAGMDRPVGAPVQVSEVESVTDDEGDLQDTPARSGDRDRMQAHMESLLREAGGAPPAAGSEKEQFFMTEPPPHAPHPPRPPVREVEEIDDGTAPAPAASPGAPYGSGRGVAFSSPASLQPALPSMRKVSSSSVKLRPTVQAVSVGSGLALAVEPPPPPKRGEASPPQSPPASPGHLRALAATAPAASGDTALARRRSSASMPFDREDSFLKLQATSARAVSVLEMSANLKDLAAQLFVQERGYTKMIASCPPTARVGSSSPSDAQRAGTLPRHASDRAATARPAPGDIYAGNDGSAGGRYALSYYRSAPEELHSVALADELGRHGVRFGATNYERFKKSLSHSTKMITQRCAREMKRCLTRRELFLDVKQAALAKLAGAERLGQKNSGWQPTSKELHRIIFRLAVSREAKERYSARCAFLSTAQQLVDNSYAYVSDCYVLLDRLRSLFDSDDATFDPPAFFELVETFPPSRFLQEGLRSVIDLIRPLFRVSEDEWAVYAKRQLRLLEETNISLLLDSTIDASHAAGGGVSGVPTVARRASFLGLPQHPAPAGIGPSGPTPRGAPAYKRYRLRVHHVKGLDVDDDTASQAKYFIILRSEWVYDPSAGKGGAGWGPPAVAMRPQPLSTDLMHVPAPPGGRSPAGRSSNDGSRRGRSAVFTGVGPPGDSARERGSGGRGGDGALDAHSASGDTRPSLRSAGLAAQAVLAVGTAGGGGANPPRGGAAPAAPHAPHIDASELRKEHHTSIAAGRPVWNEEFGWCLRAVQCAVVEILLYDLNDVKQAPIGTATLLLDETVKLKPGARTKLNLPLSSDRHAGAGGNPHDPLDAGLAPATRDFLPDKLSGPTDPAPQMGSLSTQHEIVVSLMLADGNARYMHAKKAPAQK